eukprot:6471979-Amphidinium_carterae.1
MMKSSQTPYTIHQKMHLQTSKTVALGRLPTSVRVEKRFQHLSVYAPSENKYLILPNCSGNVSLSHLAELHPKGVQEGSMTDDSGYNKDGATAHKAGDRRCMRLTDWPPKFHQHQAYPLTLRPFNMDLWVVEIQKQERAEKGHFTHGEALAAVETK